MFYLLVFCLGDKVRNVTYFVQVYACVNTTKCIILCVYACIRVWQTVISNVYNVLPTDFSTTHAHDLLHSSLNISAANVSGMILEVFHYIVYHS